MIIIGEKINGTIPSVAKAIAERDEKFLIDRAVSQSKAGATYIDVHASVEPDKEVEVLRWLMRLVEDNCGTPLAIDSPNPSTLVEVLPFARQVGIVNSVSGEGEKCEIVFPHLKGNDWQVVALTCDDEGIPYEAQKKCDIAKKIIDKAAAYDITPDRIHIDPLVMALSTEANAFINFAEAIRLIKDFAPTVHITSGLSNISYGLPIRRTVNQAFMAISILSGMDSAVMDPLDRDIMGIIAATEALVKTQRVGKFIRQYKKGLIGPKLENRK